MANRRYQEIRERTVGNSGNRILLVEGPDDVNFYTLLFEQLYSIDFLSRARVVIEHAGSKREVRRLLEMEPEWYGIVDRDEWTDQEVSGIQSSLPHLFVFPRFCIESTIVYPPELIEKLRQLHLDESVCTQIEAAITSELPMFLRHGALWKALIPLNEKLTAMRFSNFFDQFPLPSEAEIEARLKQWSSLVDRERMLSDYHENQRLFERADAAAQYRLYIHGKKFWENVVYHALCAQLPQVSEERLKRELFRLGPVPEDIKAFIRNEVSAAF